MKILYVIDSLKSGGKERRMLSLVKNIVEDNNIECEVIVFNSTIHFTEILDLQIRTHIIDRSELSKLNTAMKVYNITKNFGPDIIHAWDTLSTLYTIPIARLKRIKIITSKVSDAPNKYSRLSIFGIQSEFCFAFSDIILSNSNAGAKAYKVIKKKLKIIKNGFDISRIMGLKTPEFIKHKYRIKESIVIGMVASFKQNKDYMTFLEAAVALTERYKDIAFVCVGDGPTKEYFESIYLSTPNIYFLGQQKDVESIVNTFTIGVLTTFTEGISNTIIEYMILGKPVIATNGGGTCELVEDGVTGNLIKVREKDELIARIDYILENPEIASKMGSKGKQRILDHFSIEQMVQNHLLLYKDICNCEN